MACQKVDWKFRCFFFPSFFFFYATIRNKEDSLYSIFTEHWKKFQCNWELIRSKSLPSHCSVFTRWAVRSFATVNPQKVSTLNSSFSFSSHIICLLSDGSCKLFSLMYSQILLTTLDLGSALSPVPRNFAKASESFTGARKAEFPALCRFSFLFGSSWSSSLSCFRCFSFGAEFVEAAWFQRHFIKKIRDFAWIRQLKIKSNTYLA